LEKWVELWNVDRFVSLESIREVPSPVYYASLLGFDLILSKLLCENLPDGSFSALSPLGISDLVNAKGGEFGNALQAASYGGYSATVELLMSKGAHINVQGGGYGNALQAASYRGHSARLYFLAERAIVATYFTTKRSLAIGIVASDGSIGSVVCAIVFYRLLSEVGFPWATRALGFIALGTLSISIAVLRSHLPPAKVARSMLDLQAFKNKPFSLFSIGLFLSFAGLYVPIFCVIIYTETHLHIDTDLSFYILPLLNAASVVGRILPGLWAVRFGSLELVIVCTFLAAIFAYIGIVVVNLGGLFALAIL
jgi:hypothetical protein